MVRATFSRLEKPRLEFELRSASCRPPQRLQRHTPHSNWSDDTELASGRIRVSAVAGDDESVPSLPGRLLAKTVIHHGDSRSVRYTGRRRVIHLNTAVMIRY